MTDRESYIRQETVTGVVPMLKGDRQYSFLDLFLSTSGFAIATWCYTQGAYVAQYLSFSRMLINIFCFNIVWVFIECLPVIFATRYGIDLWIWLRSVLGRRGVCCPRSAWQTSAGTRSSASLFSSSMINLAAKFGLVLNAAVWSPVLGCLCVVLGTLIALGGPNVISTNRFLVTALLAVGVVVVVLCFTAVPLREIVGSRCWTRHDAAAGVHDLGRGQRGVRVLVVNAGAGPAAPGQDRARRLLGTTPPGVVAPFFVAAGGVMALAMFVRTGVYESDPTNMLSYLCGSGFALLSLLLVAFANVGTQGTGSYVNCMIVKSGMPKVSYKVLVLIAMVYVSALTVWGGVEEHFGAFISIAAFIQAPIIGMIVVDYLVVKAEAVAQGGHFIEGHDAYRFTGGFNLVGIGCVILSCLITILFVYNPLTGSIQSPLFLIFTGSGFDAICGGLLYWLASLTPLQKYMLRDRDDLEIV
ncbi:MAG: permease [Oscillospiraceae bacterium]